MIPSPQGHAKQKCTSWVVQVCLTPRARLPCACVRHPSIVQPCTRLPCTDVRHPCTAQPVEKCPSTHTRKTYWQTPHSVSVCVLTAQSLFHHLSHERMPCTSTVQPCTRCKAALHNMTVHFLFACPDWLGIIISMPFQYSKENWLLLPVTVK